MFRLRLAVAVAALLSSVLLTACPSTPHSGDAGPCSITNCSGCCQGNQCIQLVSETNAVCGLEGAACASCGSASCLLGACTSGNGGDGGSGDGGSCGPSNCSGCCLGTRCVQLVAENNSNCGIQGAACASCATGTCTQGTCQNSGSDGGSCGPSNCSGCCQGTQCVQLVAQNNTSCGIQGAACASCGTSNCTQGYCQGANTDGGNCSPPSNCNGCCLGNSCVALAQETNSTCGFGGSACITCTSPDTCNEGVCAACVISNVAYNSGDFNPNNVCQLCSPALTATQWSPRPNGLLCGGTGQICQNGTCASGCYIGGSLYGPGATNPSNVCQSCNPSLNTSFWTSVANGTTCGAGQVCDNSSCQSGCYINFAFYLSGATNPANRCQSCQPSISTSAWNNVTDGTSCTGGACQTGTCTPGCYINATFYPPSTANPANGCQSCQPASSTTAWTASNGLSCDGGEVCYQSTCQSGCWVSATFYPPDGGTSCATCNPGVSTTGLQSYPNNTACGDAGFYCESGSCATGCVLADAGFVGSGGSCGTGADGGTLYCWANDVCQPGFAGCGRFSGATGTSWASVANAPISGGGFSDYTTMGAGVIYQAGGLMLQRYTISTNTWTNLAAPPVGLGSWAGPAWVGNALYVIAGGQVNRYDIATNTWSVPKTGVANASNSNSAHDDQGNVYAVGTGATVIKYNIASNTATTITPVPAIGSPADPVIAFDSCSGMVFVGPAWSSPLVYSVNPNTGASAQIASVTGQVNDSFCSDRSGHLYSGGTSSGSVVYQYTVSTNTWAPLPTSLFSSGTSGSCTIGDDSYLYYAPGTGPLQRIQLR